MPEFLTTRGIVSRIESIISDSKDVLFLISPYLSYIPDSITIRIKEALERKVKVALIFRSVDEIHPKEIEKLNSLKGMNLFYNPNLHAKAFYNERDAVIASFNLSGYSEANNIEFGIHITKMESREMFEKLIYETRIILRTSKPVLSPDKSFTLEEITEGIFDTSGYCIRCKVEIDFDYKKPFCPECYRVWRGYNVRSHKEQYCHFCGERQQTTIDEPICESCYDDLEIITERD